MEYWKTEDRGWKLEDIVSFVLNFRGGWGACPERSRRIDLSRASHLDRFDRP